MDHSGPNHTEPEGSNAWTVSTTKDHEGGRGATKEAAEFAESKAPPAIGLLGHAVLRN